MIFSEFKIIQAEAILNEFSIAAKAVDAARNGSCHFESSS